MCTLFFRYLGPTPPSKKTFLPLLLYFFHSFFMEISANTNIFLFSWYTKINTLFKFFCTLCHLVVYIGSFHMSAKRASSFFSTVARNAQCICIPSYYPLPCWWILSYFHTFAIVNINAVNNLVVSHFTRMQVYLWNNFPELLS